MNLSARPEQFKTSSGRYAHIDALRALAVLLVVFSHAGFEWIFPGNTGVTIFFVISGFIITTLLVRERQSSGGFNLSAFYLRRIFKLAPPFLCIIVVPTIIYAQFQHVRISEVAAQMFFIFNWIYMQGGGHHVLPGSGVVWSLAIEEQFYIVFALGWILALRSKRCLNRLAIVAVFAAVIPIIFRVIYHVQGQADIRILYGTETRVDSLAIGVLCAILYASREQARGLSRRFNEFAGSVWSPTVALCLLACSALLRQQAYKDTLRPSAESLAAALLILFGLLRQDGRVRLLLGKLAGLSVIQTVGLASYSIYLVHLPLIHLITYLFGAPSTLMKVTCVAIGVLAGVVVWQIVERPMLVLRKRLVGE